MSNQIYLTFLHKILYGFGFGFGMGLSWKLMPINKNIKNREEPQQNNNKPLEVVQKCNSKKEDTIKHSADRPYWGTARG